VFGVSVNTLGAARDIEVTTDTASPTKTNGTKTASACVPLNFFNHRVIQPDSPLASELEVPLHDYQELGASRK
jgi:hypothetical protein